MVTIEIQPNTKVALDQILNGVANLETKDLETFLGQVAHLLAKRKAKNLSITETKLLLKINEQLPPLVWQRYDELQEKLQQETITDLEHSELLTIIEQMESHNVEWIQALSQLAQIRNTSLKELMKELGIRRPHYV